MNTIQILAAFDWLEQEMPIGDVGYESLRGTTTYQFAYHSDWLQRYRNIMLSKDLPMVAGYQYTKGNIFGMLQDALPDRWGKQLIQKRERLLAEKEQRLPRHLSDADYLLQLDDTTRMGGIRLCQNGQYIGTQEKDCSIPPLTHIREFIDLAHAFEQSEMDGTTIHEQWLYNLYRQGSSLGGARPKACVQDTNGNLYIAKIPSIHDEYDIALWEHFACCLAREAGIRVAETRLLHVDGMRYHTLLTRRFDRNGNQRIHFASAMTLCGLSDGASADSGNGYPDIVDMIIGQTNIADVHATLCELFRRVAFNCMIGNHDDHFRNHGFLLTSNGWEWSPAYDLNPTMLTTQSLLINHSTNKSDIALLEASSAEYLLSDLEAQTIIHEVSAAVRRWRQVATRCGISPSEQNRFAMRLDNPLG